MDIQYVCTQICNLSGVPIRVYEKEKLLSFYSVVTLPQDPFAIYQKEVFGITDPVGYYITPFEDYYGVVRSGDLRVVMGPTSQIPLPEQTLHEIAFQAGVKKENLKDFISACKQIVALPLASVVQYLCLINHLLNKGEKRTIFDVSIIEGEQNAYERLMGKESAERTIREADATNDPYPHNTLGVEEYMLELVRRGDVSGLKDFFENAPAVRGGVMAESNIRQMKNLFVVTATLVSRAAIRGGMDAEEALSLSDSYIRKSEPMSTISALTGFTYRMVMDYAERMKSLHYGDDLALPITEVNDYIRRHLSEPITVNDMARALCRGRSRLSADFKKKTGENLSVFIVKRKIEEAKRLLRYTDKPAVDIALYLGFSSQSHFSRAFKKCAGQTPNAYRKAGRE